MTETRTMNARDWLNANSFHTQQVACLECGEAHARTDARCAVVQAGLEKECADAIERCKPDMVWESWDGQRWVTYERRDGVVSEVRS